MMLSRLKKKKVQNYILLVGLLVALIIVVVPLLMLGEYDYKSIDDFWYSAHGEKCIAEGYGFFAFIKAMWLDTWDSYKHVQGTLLATFITRILEGLISSEYYRVVVYIMLPFIVLPEIFFALRTGQAKHYREQNEERLAILEDENVKVAVIKAFTDEPYLLFNKDAKGIEEIYENYYGKEEVIVIE